MSQAVHSQKCKTIKRIGNFVLNLATAQLKQTKVKKQFWSIVSELSLWHGQKYTFTQNKNWKISKNNL